ncbi:hypothetical protein LJX78_02435, partial [Methanimicrococcus blatticola]
AGDVIYTAQYSSAVNNYTIKWVNYNDELLETDLEVDYGTTPAYDGVEPTRADDALNTYTFSGWDPVISPVAGDVTYKAVFNSYIKWGETESPIDNGKSDANGGGSNPTGGATVIDPAPVDSNLIEDTEGFSAVFDLFSSKMNMSEPDETDSKISEFRLWIALGLLFVCLAVFIGYRLSRK